MINFYFLPNIILILLFVIAAITTSFQAAHAWIIAFNNLKKRMLEFLCELSLTFFLLLLASMPVFAMVHRLSSVVHVETYSLYYIFAIILSMCFLVLITLKKIYNAIPLIAITLTLPIIPFNELYPLYYTIAIFCLLIRALHAVLKEQIRKRTEVSAFTIKQGVDTLPTGVLFSGEDGHIFLINTCMLELMEKFFKREYKNAKNFWKDLLIGKIKNAQSHLLENTIVLRSSSESWSFIRRSFMIHNTAYVELIATNITETDKILLTLEEDSKKLLEQNKEIQTLTENMITLRKEQEYSRIRSQIHDVMGQRLTAIQRLLQSEEPADCNQIIPLLQNIVENIREERKENAGELLLELCLYFERIGIIIDLKNELPKDENIAYLFLTILREATTNAARHAEATKIFVEIKETEKIYELQISNNGKKPKSIGAEGSGLTGIRNRVENNRGTLKIEWLPRFIINIAIQKVIESSGC